jgi:hypothetical protein
MGGTKTMQAVCCNCMGPGKMDPNVDEAPNGWAPLVEQMLDPKSRVAGFVVRFFCSVACRVQWTERRERATEKAAEKAAANPPGNKKPAPASLPAAVRRQTEPDSLNRDPSNLNSSKPKIAVVEGGVLQSTR